MSRYHQFLVSRHHQDRDAGNLPPIGHLARAAASMVEGILVVTVSTADSNATRGVPRPTCVKRSIAFCTMSRLASRSGKMLMAASVRNSVSA